MRALWCILSKMRTFWKTFTRQVGNFLVSFLSLSLETESLHGGKIQEALYSPNYFSAATWEETIIDCRKPHCRVWIKVHLLLMLPNTYYNFLNRYTWLDEYDGEIIPVRFKKEISKYAFEVSTLFSNTSDQRKLNTCIYLVNCQQILLRCICMNFDLTAIYYNKFYLFCTSRMIKKITSGYEEKQWRLLPTNW